MTKIPFAVGGQHYNNFDEAWDAYYTYLHGDGIVDSETYHDEKKAFLSGAISAINVLSVRINNLASEKISCQQQVGTAIMSTLNEAMELASESFKR